MNLNKIDNAVYYYLFIKKQFNKETFKKYSELFSKLQKDNKKFAEQLKKIEKGPSSSLLNPRNILIVGAIILLVVVIVYSKYKQNNLEETVF